MTPLHAKSSQEQCFSTISVHAAKLGTGQDQGTHSDRHATRQTSADKTLVEGAHPPHEEIG